MKINPSIKSGVSAIFPWTFHSTQAEKQWWFFKWPVSYIGWSVWVSTKRRGNQSEKKVCFGVNYALSRVMFTCTEWGSALNNANNFLYRCEIYKFLMWHFCTVYFSVLLSGWKCPSALEKIRVYFIACLWFPILFRSL